MKGKDGQREKKQVKRKCRPMAKKEKHETFNAGRKGPSNKTPSDDDNETKGASRTKKGEGR